MEISFKNLIINFTKKFYENFRTKKNYSKVLYNPRQNKWTYNHAIKSYDSFSKKKNNFFIKITKLNLV